MKPLFIILLCFQATFSKSQVIFSNPIAGTNPNTSNPFTAGQLTAQQLQVSGIGRGPGITGSNANERYNATGWTTSLSIDLNDYFEWTLIPSTGYEMHLQALTYISQRSASGPQLFSLRCSLDGYATDIGNPPATGAAIHLDAATFSHLTVPVTFRLYGWNATAGTGTFSVNEFSFTGNIQAIQFLPVQFSQVQVSRVENTMRIRWTNETEESVVRYQVERAKPGYIYHIIGQQKALYNHYGVAAYCFTDADAPVGELLYRIAAIEQSGRMIYSEVVKVRNQATPAAFIFPNPVNEQLNLSIPLLTKGKYTCRIVNMNGAVLHKIEFHHEGGKYAHELNLSQWKNGMYFLMLEGKEKHRIAFIKP